MKNKSYDTYRRIWLKLSEYIDISARTSISDLELASINAFHSVFPEVEINCCFFHFIQCIWRSIQREGLTTQYGNNEILQKHLKILSGLAFVDPEEVTRYYELLEDKTHEVGLSTILRPVLDYMEHNCIGRFIRN
ncbi:hypothetical protein RF11_00830 [Thelohanellus kitauei]|uniref:MULE transposase domain-containing protein n=1 Tax=Thelohanellus kitauei TaxID=669202 RepID=A0A0C2IFH4_THEKT|nr:hypothetical protein RF11_00830 [Thelohanellus kitauei]